MAPRGSSSPLFPSIEKRGDGLGGPVVAGGRPMTIEPGVEGLPGSHTLREDGGQIQRRDRVSCQQLDKNPRRNPRIEVSMIEPQTRQAGAPAHRIDLDLARNQDSTDHKAVPFTQGHELCQGIVGSRDSRREVVLRRAPIDLELLP